MQRIVFFLFCFIRHFRPLCPGTVLNHTYFPLLLLLRGLFLRMVLQWPTVGITTTTTTNGVDGDESNTNKSTMN